MTNSKLRIAVGLLLCGIAVFAQAATPDVPEEHVERAKAGMKLFQQQVRPLLLTHCVDCHGGKSTKADFDLTTRDSLMDSGYVDETAADSYVMQLIRHEEEPAMPFKAERLSEDAIASIAKWIDLGAPYDKPLVEKSADPAADGMQVTEADRKFWSFQRLGPVALPAVANGQWPRNEIDRFILAKLEDNSLQPALTADRRTFIRRATLDLLGLPPSPSEVDAFVNDCDPQAYEKLIDRLLQSEHYGERWARHWMDVARFAESSGFEHDYDRPSAYHYRDFLIEAFNQDIAWDEMVRWQIAGDELAPENPLALKATGFLAAGVFPTQLTETEFESTRYDELADMAGTLSVAFLGLSTACARCHDHKFDPIPARDYYRLAANFSTAIRCEVEMRTDPQTGCVIEISSHLRKGPDADQPPALAGAETVQITSERFKPIKHHADDRGYPHFYPQVFYLQRGDVNQKDGVAEAGFLQVLMPAESQPVIWQWEDDSNADFSYRRTALAGWITDHQQGAGHLLARVIVNRLWQHHFGRGIVTTPNDFGFQGARPTHPELLDWLAQDLIAHGWKLKRLHKLIMTSATYRQNAYLGRPLQADKVAAGQTDKAVGVGEVSLGTASHDAVPRDVENLYLWHYPSRRLEAEAIRDSLLVVSGQLDPTMYGTGSLIESMRRRSVYFTVKRSRPIPMMQVFDWPEHLVSIGDRSTTTIAPQALALMNSPQVREYAEAFAKRVRPNADVSISDAVTSAYRIAVSREPLPLESKRAIAFIQAQSDRYTETSDPQHFGLADFCQALTSSNEFLHLP